MPRFQPLGRVVVSSAADIIIAALLVGCGAVATAVFVSLMSGVRFTPLLRQVAADERMLIATTIFLYLFLRS